MTNEAIFWTQVVSLVAFISTLFVLYRVLIKQKDATIETLREQREGLREELRSAKQSSPDVLLPLLQKRIDILSDELERLNEDREGNEVLIARREQELSEAREAMNRLRALENILGELFCPDCGAPLMHLDAGSYPVGRYEADYEVRTFSCGRTVRDNEEEEPCPRGITQSR
jgi:transcription initiation factor IIE alpha subunit